MSSSIQEINPRRINKINFDNLVVEIGFGNGVYISHLARLYPNKNFLGIEISGESIKKLSRIIKRENLKNLYSIKLDAYWTFYLFLEDNSVYEIYINFPDPWPKKKHQDRRLTKLENLYLFSKKLKYNGFIQLKTDHFNFYNYTIENAKVLNCFEIIEYKNFHEEIKTKYEEKWLKMKRSIYTLKLVKLSEPKLNIPIKTIRRSESMSSLKIKNFIDFKKLEGKVFKIEEDLVVKFFKSFEREDEWMIETLLSENGYKHYFFTYLRKKGNEYVLSISSFSEVLKTEGIIKFIKWLSNLDTF
ncbi:MAG: tRNA (guanosine(46)-N7)-methyltransferase TrmB [candidate division WOR-3 bacterium]|nr:tRNA (guanosine(46)-N7)-methyltransferase TrmB [candidate division WOR-3 bacterium]MCX7947211.1 tRNA (guanosine(46)-N7)-methyltransferase TrmB [candidate division WOR-3 bacterium]MDW8150267.1 tRNA (guanosine(46)-N7)-methyltransferase TrmB [candidate division WOR-3 bacterium]